jgi:SAM-dependent methyltransferase
MLMRNIALPYMESYVIASLVDAYDNCFQIDNVYGHALDLLLRNRGSSPQGAIHLDIGCGYGRIAEPLTEALGVKYVGCDLNPVALESLIARGFETHRICLGEEEKTFTALVECVAGRPVASISILDTLEHLPDTAAMLGALNRLAALTGAMIVVSVPNVANFDIGAKLLLGRWDVTDVGILDHTHMRTFSAKTFERELRASGLHVIEWNNTKPPVTDQHFPLDHPLLSESTELGGLLLNLRRTTDAEHANVLQLVCQCVAGPRMAVTPFAEAYAPERRPFLTALVRTQGRRLHTLRETLVCLHGQTDRDIEIIVIGHRLEGDVLKGVERVIDDQPEDMRECTQLIRVNDGNRTRPLNVGFAAARGRYIAILDDDDIPLAHWVETFRAMDRRASGRLLRTACVRQDVQSVVVQGRAGLRAEGAPERCYPATFNPLEHLRSNLSPPICLAFPRGAYHDLGLHFDETLTTTEDWDYVMRVALLLGTESSPEVTGVYRWWVKGESSRTEHDQAEWDRNHQAILRSMDSRPLLLPQGITSQLRELLNHCDFQNLRVGELETDVEMLQQRVDELQIEPVRLIGEIEHLRNEGVRWQAELLEIRASVQRSFALRLARSVPRPIRTFIRRAASGGRWLFRANSS